MLSTVVNKFFSSSSIHWRSFVILVHLCIHLPSNRPSAYSCIHLFVCLWLSNVLLNKFWIFSSIFYEFVAIFAWWFVILFSIFQFFQFFFNFLNCYVFNYARNLEKLTMNLKAKNENTYKCLIYKMLCLKTNLHHLKLL